MKKHIILIIILLCIFTTSVYGEYLFGMGDQPYTLYGKTIELFYTEVFNRLGLINEVTIEYFPLKRLEMMLLSEKLDGDLARTYAYGVINPDLIRIEEPPYIADIAVFSWDRGLYFRSWDELRDSGLRIECILGDERCKMYLEKNSYTEASTWKQALGRLLRRDIDVFIHIKETIEYALEIEPLDIYNIGIVSFEPLYMYIHPKHSQIIKPVLDIIWNMKQEGYDQKCKDAALIITKDTHLQ